MWALSGSVSFTCRKVIPFGFTVSGAVSPSAAFAGSRAHVLPGTSWSGFCPSLTSAGAADPDVV